jgi:nucleoside-diphosphate-sugar epimerase
MTSDFHLLTGATGLVGSYLVQRLLQGGHHLAVLVRPSKRLTAERRVDKILSFLEHKTGETLPKPYVISGDLQNNVWVNEHRDFLFKNCRSVIHCAASLTFYGSQDDEPYVSNVRGTKQILDLCKDFGIEDLHYFSTAYIAGSSERFYEDQLDSGQELRNDYEKSKFLSENLVRNAEHIKKLTIYRPSIVVGDAQTGYTSSFHGFYAVLKLAHTLVRRMPRGSTSGRNLLTALGLDGTERKNFVPVDWVADSFMSIFTQPELHGKTYHQTSPNPILLNDMVDVIQDAVETFSALADESDPLQADETWFFKNYINEVQIYRAYLQNDPEFDSANIQLACPNLLCPKTDKELMFFLARYAIQSNFGKRKQEKNVGIRQETGGRESV